MNFSIEKRIPSADEYLALRQSVGWHAFNVDDCKKGLCNTLFGVCVMRDNTIIGMGRIVGDGCICFYLQDIVVRPNEQRRGIGKIIMQTLLAYLYENAGINAYIGLMASKNAAPFYKKFGFIERPNETMDSGMVLPNFKVQ